MNIKGNELQKLLLFQKQSLQSLNSLVDKEIVEDIQLYKFYLT